MATESIHLTQDDLNQYLAAAVKRERDLDEALSVLNAYANGKSGTNNVMRRAQQRVSELRIAQGQAANQIEDLKRWGARIQKENHLADPTSESP